MPDFDEFKSKLPIRVGGRRVEHVTRHHCICAKLFELLYNNDENGCHCDFCLKKGGSLQNLLGNYKDITNSSTQTNPIVSTLFQTIPAPNSAEKYIETLLEPKPTCVNYGSGEQTWSIKRTQSSYSTSTGIRDTKSLEDIQLLLSTINENLESILSTLKDKKEQLKSQTLLKDDKIEPDLISKPPSKTNIKIELPNQPTNPTQIMPTIRNEVPSPFVPNPMNNLNAIKCFYTVPGLLYRYKPSSCPNINLFERLGKIYSHRHKSEYKACCGPKYKKNGKKIHKRIVREYNDCNILD